MKRSIAQVAKVIASLILLSPPAQGAVTFSTGSASTTPGGNVSVPVIVSGFANVDILQFTLAWNPGVIQFTSVGSFGLPSFEYFGLDEPTPNLDNFGTFVADGKLTVSWNSSPQTLQDGASIFNMNFTAFDTPGSTPVWFTNSPTTIEVYVNTSLVTPEFSVGTVSVVPEPINIALGIFAGMFAGGTTLRWFLRKRSVRSAACS